MTDAAPPLLIAPPPPGWRGQVVSSPQADRLAVRSLTFGALSFVVNPFLLCSIIGITSGRKSLKLGTANRSMAIAGIITGVAGLVAVVIALVVGVVVGLHAHDAALQHSLESSIMRSSASSQGTVLSDVTCPVPHDPRSGVTLVCSARTPDAEQVRLEVTFTSGSTFTAQLLHEG